MPVYVKHNETACISRNNSRIKLANRMLLEDIHRESMMKTPFKQGSLRKSVTKEVQNKSGIIIWHEPYAQYQERGRRAKTPYHPVKKYTTAGTGPHFAKNAVEKVLKKNLSKYFKF